MAETSVALPRAGAATQAAATSVKSPRLGDVVVETRELTKRYDALVAVDRLDLRLREGEIFGLLGPNGAGKTTTILMLMGLTEPTAGFARVLGFDPVRQPLEVKRRVGYLPEHVALYEDLSARENLHYTADLNAIPLDEAKRRASEALERVGLAEAADRKVREFSHGMRQRLGIADVLIKQPKLVILDEPTLGLDPQATQDLLELILAMSKEQRLSVLLSSHQLIQVQRICDRVGIFAKGRLIAQGPILELARELAAGLQVLEVGAAPGGPELAELLARLPGVESVERDGEQWRVRAHGDARPAIARAVVERGWSLLHLRQRDFGLEEIYLRYFREG